MGSFTKLKKILEEKDSFLLIGHERPDGDSIGALLALGDYLRTNNKQVLEACSSPIPAVFMFLPGAERIKQDFLLGDYDCVILIDNGDLKRTGFPERLKNAGENILIINIDHHQKNDIWRLAGINLADPEASSASEIVYKLILGLGGEVTSNMATCLLAGIYNDTGSLQHDNTDPEILAIVSDLMLLGGKLKPIIRNVKSSHSIGKLKLWGIALDKMVLNNKYNTVFTILTQNDLETANASEDDVSGLVNLISTTPEAGIALLIYETGDGKIKGSFRTETKVDLSILAGLLGGGGHKKASGFSLSGKLVFDKKRGYRII